jgi:L-Ala-D/L-Glu epimerase
LPATIASYRIIPVDVVLLANFAIAGSDHSRAHNVIVLLTDSEGRTGIGEAAPFPILTGDDHHIARSALETLAPALVNQSVCQILSKKLGPLRQEFKSSPTALAAFETALWDLRAQELQVPLASLFGPADLLEVETDLTIPILPRNESINLWQSLAHKGFNKIKFKVGGTSIQEDADRVISICRLHPSAEVILDGNQGLTPESTLKLITLVDQAGIKPKFFEQPLPEKAWTDYARLTAASPIPICLDETVRTAKDALRVVTEKTAHMINLKFMKSGITEALAIATIAKSAGLGLMIGGMVESEITMTASLHFACGLGTIEWHDLDTPFFLTRSLCQGSPFLGNCHLQRSQAPGLGLTWVE